jgi:hypothetical protein
MITIPTEQLVAAACKAFDDGNLVTEQALTELFEQYPSNETLHHVFLKVVTLNTLYQTQIRLYSENIPDLMDVALHIHQNAKEIDSALVDGLPDIVDKIAKVTPSGKKARYHFSFATKYCSWHKPELYPIWDSRVDRYVHGLKPQPHYAEFFDTGEEHWRYSEFRRLIILFRESYGLTKFTFKQIDKFLYSYGGPSTTATT